jgi:anti-sigma regulatory factor (Ser/Thr protein kinase)
VTEASVQTRVIALDRLWPAADIGRSGDLLDTVFGWSDLGQLRRMVTVRCVAAGLPGPRVEEFVLAIHEIAANAIMHAGARARLILRLTASGLRCLIADAAPVTPNIPLASPALDNVTELRVPDSLADARERREPGERMGAESGRGLWLAAQLADELSITSGAERTVVSLYKYFE